MKTFCPFIANTSVILCCWVIFAITTTNVHYSGDLHTRSLAEPSHQAERVENSIGMKLIRIPRGKFLMGSHEAAAVLEEAYNRDAGLFGIELPQHEVKISRDFYIGVHEVTLGSFRKFIEAEQYETDFEKVHQHDDKPYLSWKNVPWTQTDQHPVVMVSWNDADAFCKWLSRKEE